MHIRRVADHLLKHGEVERIVGIHLVPQLYPLALQLLDNLPPNRQFNIINHTCVQLLYPLEAVAEVWVGCRVGRNAVARVDVRNIQQQVHIREQVGMSVHVAHQRDAVVEGQVLRTAHSQLSIGSIAKFE